MYQNRIDLLQSTLDMLILRTLAWGAQYGYGIANAIRAGSGDVLHAETGSLYPALHRLENKATSKPNGSSRRKASARNTTASRPRDANALRPNTHAGNK